MKSDFDIEKSLSEFNSASASNASANNSTNTASSASAASAALLSNVGIDGKRLKQLQALVDRYDALYRQLNRMSRHEQARVLPDITEIYVPNVLNDIPSVLNRVDVQARYIEHLEKLNVRYKSQIRKAYAYLKWTNNDYYDVAECLPDDPAELDGIDPLEIITPPRRSIKKKKSRAKVKK